LDLAIALVTASLVTSIAGASTVVSSVIVHLSTTGCSGVAVCSVGVTCSSCSAACSA